jgi:hypothetical protein
MNRPIMFAIAIASVVACKKTEPATGCTKDTDCKGDRICQAGECVTPATTSAATSTEATSTTRGSDRPEARRNDRGSRDRLLGHLLIAAA